MLITSDDDRHTMRTYIVFIVSAGLLLAAATAALLLHGGPEAIAAGVGLLVGPLCLGSLTVLLTAADRDARTGAR